MNNTIKVCHLTSVHYYNDTRIYYKECCTLAERGYETYFIVPEAPTQFNSLVHFCSVATNRQNRLSRMTHTVWSIYSQARRLNADIYHFHDPELMLIGLLLRIQGKKVIYDVHEDVPRQILSKSYIPQYFRYFISEVIENLENFACKHFDGIVAATPLIHERFLKIASNTINVNNFPILNELYTLETSWEEKEMSVCYVGGISEQRGIFEMVDAIAQTEARLLLAGSFLCPEQRRKAIKMPGWNSVQELGPVDRNGLAQALAKSIAGLVILHPIVNYFDALPVKMFEYMCAGIPVIASDFPLWKEIVEGNECGICVDPMDPKAITAAIKWITNNPEKAKFMGQNGRKAVEKKYNWEKEGKNFCNFYQEITSTMNTNKHN
jgi:glycosyltransferase involved in cell wall biosynthesis